MIETYCGVCDHSSGQLDGLPCVYCHGTGIATIRPIRPVAILSTTILPRDGLYAVCSGSLDMPLVAGVVVWPLAATAAPVQSLDAIPSPGGNRAVEVWFAGIAHYIGHPDTKTFVERLGAVPAPGKLFAGLGVGEAALAICIRQGRSTRASLGHTEAHQAVTEGDLETRVVLRVA